MRAKRRLSNNKVSYRCLYALLIGHASRYSKTIIYYNSAILSRRLTKFEVRGNTKALALITQISPAAVF